MKNQKQAILLVLALVILGLVIGYSVYKNKHAQKPDVAVTIPDTTSPAWNVFEQYLSYAKNHDVDKLKTVVSETIITHDPNCPMRQVQTGLNCDDLMDAVYKEGITLKQADFVNTWEDAKQIILSTKVTKKASTDLDKENYEMYYLFFTKGQDGNPKFLASYGLATSFLYTGILKTPARKKSDVAAAFLDADKDGLLDKYEDCVTNKDQIASPYNYQCSTTNPSKRDSLHDGWWDGVRTFLAKP